MIDEGLALLDGVLAAPGAGPYRIEAAIAALHARAPRPEDTDWPQIVALYGGLLRARPDAGRRAQPRGGGRDGRRPGRRAPSARADRRRAGRLPPLPRARPTCCGGWRDEDAVVAYERALGLATNAAERLLGGPARLPALGSTARCSSRRSISRCSSWWSSSAIGSSTSAREVAFMIAASYLSTHVGTGASSSCLRP